MAGKNKVKVSTEPTTYRLTSTERRAAQLAQIASKQGQLKREAAERRAKRATEAEANSNARPTSVPGDAER